MLNFKADLTRWSVVIVHTVYRIPRQLTANITLWKINCTWDEMNFFSSDVKSLNYKAWKLNRK